MLAQGVAAPDARGQVPEPIDHSPHGGEGSEDREQNSETEFQVSHALNCRHASSTAEASPLHRRVPHHSRSAQRFDGRRLPLRADAIDPLRLMRTPPRLRTSCTTWCRPAAASRPCGAYRPVSDKDPARRRVSAMLPLIMTGRPRSRRRRRRQRAIPRSSAPLDQGAGRAGPGPPQRFFLTCRRIRRV